MPAPNVPAADSVGGTAPPTLTRLACTVLTWSPCARSNTGIRVCMMSSLVFYVGFAFWPLASELVPRIASRHIRLHAERSYVGELTIRSEAKAPRPFPRLAIPGLVVMDHNPSDRQVQDISDTVPLISPRANSPCAEKIGVSKQS